MKGRVEKRIFCSIAMTVFLVDIGYGQGNIDVDELSVQMGVSQTVHVNLTESSFTIHEDPADPLIFADFTNDRVGFANNQPLQRLHLGHYGHGLGLEDQISSFPAIAGIFSTNGGGAYPFNEWGHLVVKARTEWTNYDIVFVTAANGAATPRMVVKPDGKVGIGTTSPAQTLDVNGSVNINGSSTVAGDKSFRNIVHEYSRYVGVPGGSYYDFIFQTDYSAGMTVEVITTGIVGSSASTMNSEKHVFQFYMYANTMSYQYDKRTLYQMGQETGYLDTNIYAVGSGNKFRVRVSNSHSNPYNTTVYIKVIKRAGPSLTAQF